LQANEVIQKLSKLECLLSTAPAGVTKLIDSLKNEVTSEKGKDMVASLENILNTHQKSAKDEATQSKLLVSKLLI
jgi:hypothetical protein